ncbi:hypothetical protein B4U79_17793 [Dinothrombium tinctorium]|uniref:S-phase kinase-associated protein 1-like protein n=1 Tax=Dinothrombium tinctorium TaxID=1965070 RepID=A0A3S3Q010_9ACAR|nr:hypothetical protein B4U79_16840 [Dinothrombium tinctorium]RWS00889.1 hypothetical protein B4U79_16803 [Dinothrombium tinctorium]RWS00890.1 hypothetical protein B4U79_16802 [Dinothrombium tinctorium]RWS08272.1 hypothetical protein B4U79_17793 [Dinothrombium tinctorium]
MDALKSSETFNEMIQLKIGQENEQIELPEVDSQTMEKLIEWIKHYKNQQSPDESDDKLSESKLDSWDKEFFQMPNELLFHVLTAANYLNMKRLMDKVCFVIALRLKGKTTKQMRQLMRVENDLSDQQIAEIEKEFGWCLEQCNR